MPNRAVFITGAAAGIGRATALTFAKNGYTVGGYDIDEVGLKTLADEIDQLGGTAIVGHLDVTDSDEMAQRVGEFATAAGRLDVMINNAGITRDALLVKVQDGKVVGKMSLDQWRAVIDVNLTGVFLGAREASQRMIGLGNGGVIISISSISRAGNMGQSNYSASKAGVVAMTVVWAKELARYGIRTGAIAPGFTRTEILDTMKPEMIERAVNAVPLKRMAEPAEMAHAALFIAENDYFSGRVIEVDGAQRI